MASLNDLVILEWMVDRHGHGQGGWLLLGGWVEFIYLSFNNCHRKTTTQQFNPICGWDGIFIIIYFRRHYHCLHLPQPLISNEKCLCQDSYICMLEALLVLKLTVTKVCSVEL